MINKKKDVFLQIAACIAFLVVSIILSPKPPGESIFSFTKPAIRDLIANILMLGFFYLNFYLFIPTLYFSKKYVSYFFVIVMGLLLICFAPTIISNPFHLSANPPQGGFQPANHMPPKPDLSAFVSEISHHIFLFLAVVFFSLLLKVRTRLFLAETARQDAELSYLKAQINPHFLFNTLNSIYSLALVKDDKTPDAIIQLSELMRYIIKDANDNMVLLEKEIGYIDNYIALQQSRLGDTVSIDYNTEGDFTGKQIAPLILITYIENSFKYGVNPDLKSEIIIQITIVKNELALYVYNKKVSSISAEQGIGMQNTKQRLELLYPLKHILKTRDKDELYIVELKITLA